MLDLLRRRKDWSDLLRRGSTSRKSNLKSFWCSDDVRILTKSHGEHKRWELIFVQKGLRFLYVFFYLNPYFSAIKSFDKLFTNKTYLTRTALSTIIVAMAKIHLYSTPSLSCKSLRIMHAIKAVIPILDHIGNPLELRKILNCFSKLLICPNSWHLSSSAATCGIFCRFLECNISE